MWLREARLSETGGTFACVYLRRIETGVAFARVGRASTETGVAFARVGRASTETGVAFAGEKWVYLVRFSVAVVPPVSVIAVWG